MPSANVTSDNLSTGATLGASVTDQRIIRGPVRVTHGGSLSMTVDIKVSGVTVGAGITAKVRDSSDGFTTIHDKKTASITANGTFTIKFLFTDSADFTYLPLRSSMDVVISTGVGSAVTIDSVRVTEEQ